MTNIKKQNVVSVPGKPMGWVVRSTISESGRPKTLEFGVYMDNDVFINIPLHFCVLDNHTLPLLREYSTDTVKYYTLPDDIKLKLTKINTKVSGKEIPMLVPAMDDMEESFISCLTYKTEGAESIINIETTGKVVRDYIPSSRKAFALIVVDDRPNVINKNVRTVVTTGVIGSMETISSTIDVGSIDTRTVIDLPVEQEDKVKTKFITFSRFIQHKDGEVRIGKRRSSN